MQMKCKVEARDHSGSLVMNFTQGQVYEFQASKTHEGWETLDDKGNKEYFFDPFVMFEEMMEAVK